MARTAPVPNMIAIPGMNPGLWVMAGGGVGGGGSGSGDASAATQSTSGDNGGRDAEHDSRSAAGCGAGSPGQCNNCGNRLTAGDPVDVGSGAVYTLPVRDAALDGPLPVALFRAYSTQDLRRDSGLGPGWSTSYSHEILLRRRTVLLVLGAGPTVELELPETGLETSAFGYTLRREANGFALMQGDLRASFTLLDEPNARYLLTSIADLNGNRITLDYLQFALVAIRDAASRAILFSRAAGGRIRGIDVQDAAGARQRVVDMGYDNAGRLIEVRDALGQTARYAYDEANRMTMLALPERPVYSFRYDDAGRCVETWGELPGENRAFLAAGVEPMLGDGETQARGMQHARILYQPDGYREVADSIGVRRVFADGSGRIAKGVKGSSVTTREFDENGFLISHTDALQATTQFQRDGRGNLLGMTNALGQTTLFERDHAGRLTAAYDELGTLLRVRYDARGNPVEIETSGGELTQRSYDARGLLTEQIAPDGEKTKYGYDAQGNCIEMTLPGGALFRYEYDGFGRLTGRTDSQGNTGRYAYDAASRLVQKRLSNGAVEERAYTATDELCRVTDPDGQTYRLQLWGGRPTEFVFPNGSMLAYRYNREGELLAVLNEKGEARQYLRNLSGTVREVIAFDGRRAFFEYDAMSRVVKMTNSRGEAISLERDLLGRVVSIDYPDETRAQFEYDARGRLVRAENGASMLSFELDAAGQILREAQMVDGEEIVVEYRYDKMRRPTLIRSSRGPSHEIRRGTQGLPMESILDGKDAIQFAFDPLQRETARVLPKGGAIRTEYGGEKGYSRRMALGPPKNPAQERGAPQWVADVAQNATTRKAFSYSPSGEAILACLEENGQTRRYEYDARDRLINVLRDEKTVESFRYDETGNLHEFQAPREYGPGNRLLSRGSATYRWDEEGRLVEKTIAPGQSYQYAWNGQGLLKEVRTPSGLIVDFLYDAFARRIRKRVFQAQGRALRQLSTTRYVWAKEKLLHAVTRSEGEAGAKAIQETTYYWEPTTGEPLAERTDSFVSDERKRGELLFHVNDPLGTPEDLVLGDGRKVASMKRSAFGQTHILPEGAEGTKIRFSGQIEDTETGLFDNRYRVYDPEIGRYLSPDPAGDLPDANEWRYCPNPIGFTDALGLGPAKKGLSPPAAHSPSAAPNAAALSTPTEQNPSGAGGPSNSRLGHDPAQSMAARNDGRLPHSTNEQENQLLRELPQMPAPREEAPIGKPMVLGKRVACEACQSASLGSAPRAARRGQGAPSRYGG